MSDVAKPLLILGTRTFAESVVDLVDFLPEFQVVAFVENMVREKSGQTLDGFPILWVDALAELAATHWAICALSTTTRKQFTDQTTTYGIRFATLIHPSAILPKRTTIGEGTIINAGANIAPHTKIGSQVLVNRGGMIGHHTQIGDYVTIGFGANIAGDCRIGNSTYVAMSASILPHLSIGAHSIVAAGSVVTKDVPDHVQVMGSPARIVKQDIPGL